MRTPARIWVGDCLHDNEINVEESRLVTVPVHWGCRAGPELEILLSQRGTTTSIELVGECDLAARAPVQDAIGRALAPDSECLVLDLGRVSFIDASGVGIVVALARRARAQQVRLLICPGPPAVQRVFAMCQLTDALPFLPAPPQHRAARSPVSARTGDTEAGGALSYLPQRRRLSGSAWRPVPSRRGPAGWARRRRSGPSSGGSS